MFEYIKKSWNGWGERGLRLPFVYDAASKKPSITVMFPYITFLISVASVVALHFFPSILPASITAIVFWLVSTVLYMLRKLQKASFNLEDKSFSLTGTEGSSKVQNEKEDI